MYQESTDDWTFDHTDLPPDEQAVLADRLRLASESLTSEFPGLSPSEARQVLLASANDVLGGASIAQFVPTFATRRARRLLQATQSNGGPDVEIVLDPADSEQGNGVAAAEPVAAKSELEIVLDPADSEQGNGVAAAEPVAAKSEAGAAVTAARPVSLAASAAPQWPDAFYMSESKRLLEKARRIRSDTLETLGAGVAE